MRVTYKFLTHIKTYYLEHKENGHYLFSRGRLSKRVFLATRVIEKINGKCTRWPSHTLVLVILRRSFFKYYENKISHEYETLFSQYELILIHARVRPYHGHATAGGNNIYYAPDSRNVVHQSHRDLDWLSKNSARLLSSGMISRSIHRAHLSRIP